MLNFKHMAALQTNRLLPVLEAVQIRQNVLHPSAERQVSEAVAGGSEICYAEDSKASGQAECRMLRGTACSRFGGEPVHRIRSRKGGNYYV